MTIRIGINTLFLLPDKVGGTETYVRGLIHGLTRVDKDNQYIIFTNRENISIFADICNFNKYYCDLSGASRNKRVYYEQMILPRIANKLNIDVLHSPGYVSPVTGRFAKVVTIHDMQYHYFPYYLSKIKLLYWRYFIPMSARSADVILTVSENSKIDIAEILGVSEEKIIVTYEATKFSIEETKITTREDILRSGFDVKENYILSVAAMLPHKNLEKLIIAMRLLKDRIDHKVVLVGLAGKSLEMIYRVAEAEGMKERVVVMGYVTDEELVALYRNASVFVLPSLFEGFGIPALEAMSFGCPVAASNRTSIPEIVGDGGIFFEPEDQNAMAEAIYLVVTNPDMRRKLIKNGLERAKLFSWEKTAERTLRAYEIAYKRRSY